MSKIKVAELFYSIQGEGRFMGAPSVFLRTFGCNFKCAGFGLPLGERSTEADVIAIKAKDYMSYGDLPLVSTGCDSYASWHPDFKHLSPVVTTDGIAEAIKKMVPGQGENGIQDVHLVITGGEPLLGWQRAYPDLLNTEFLKDLKFLTFETNGTQDITPAFEKFLTEWASSNGRTPREALTFSVSAKLSVSGEKAEDAIKPEVVMQYQRLGFTYLKFVVATEYDVCEALAATDIYREAGFTGPVYLMPVGGVESLYHLNKTRVAEQAIKYGLYYSDRLHVPLFKNAWGT